MWVWVQDASFLFSSDLTFNRNIWDGSLAVEKTISKGNQTVSIVSIKITPSIHLQQFRSGHTFLE